MHYKLASLTARDHSQIVRINWLHAVAQHACILQYFAEGINVVSGWIIGDCVMMRSYAISCCTHTTQSLYKMWRNKLQEPLILAHRIQLHNESLSRWKCVNGKFIKEIGRHWIVFPFKWKWFSCFTPARCKCIIETKQQSWCHMQCIWRGHTKNEILMLVVFMIKSTQLKYKRIIFVCRVQCTKKIPLFRTRRCIFRDAVKCRTNIPPSVLSANYGSIDLQSHES